MKEEMFIIVCFFYGGLGVGNSAHIQLRILNVTCNNN